ncbi:Crp/Fnr family transcriptional regulator [Aestuariicella hydrocarbonica]|uniref:Crp/Fnr family transcriptional regulator n=1 Tax=Pseudomaricurvus hydrocarbonicus TaxID=1470433 RepID=A0A9E5JXW9_9GAMM|nr:Crp/Fnr family transcriptional regulator [Aestuariicella hydrocarbonica]NHO66585.1 Crp/Fnr family transcriptional regulator [Aestuariicella hydrocarbonica]
MKIEHLQNTQKDNGKARLRAEYPRKAHEQWIYFLPAEIQDAVIANMDIRHYKRTETVYAHHSPTNEIYTVLEGCIKLTNTTLSGKDIAITTLPRGCTFGELSFIDGQPRQNIAVASTDCTLAVLTRKQYLSLSQQHPEILAGMLQFTAHRLRALVNIHQDTTSLELPQQLAKRLLFIAQKQNDGNHHSQPTEISVSQDELAATLGVSRQHVNKALKKWQTDGLLEVGYRKITLLDCEGLKEVTEDI